jgi:hypothetical protein
MNHIWIAINEFAFLLIPGIAFLANVLCNFVLISRRPAMGIVRGLLASTAAGAIVFLGLTMCWQWGPTRSLSQPDTLARICVGLLTFGSASYIFFHFVHIPIASVRIRILTELAAQGPLTEADILRTYNSADILRLRLERLERSGEIRRNPEAIVMGKPRLLYVARLFACAKRLLLGVRP